MATEDVRRVVAALITAAILGAWTFAGTRASSEDINRVREELEDVEREAKERHRELATTVEEIKETLKREAIEAAEFRAEVRSALEIRKRD